MFQYPNLFELVAADIEHLQLGEWELTELRKLVTVQIEQL